MPLSLIKFVAKILSLITAFIFAFSLLSDNSYAQQCTPYWGTASNTQVCSTKLFNSDCSGNSGQFTGTECCTNPNTINRDYCEETTIDPTGQNLAKKFRCCFFAPTPTPTPTPPPACSLVDNGSDGYRETCTGLNGPISDACNTSTSHRLALCNTSTGCYYGFSTNCLSGELCRIKSNGQPECYIPPIPTPTTAPTNTPTPTSVPTPTLTNTPTPTTAPANTPTPTSAPTNTPTPTRTPTPTPVTYRISGSVYIDNNQDGIFNGSDSGYGGSTITISHPDYTDVTRITAANGTFEFLTTNSRTYSVALTVPSGYITEVNNPASVFIGPGTEVNNAHFPLIQAPTNTPTPIRTPTPTATRTPTPTPIPGSLGNGASCTIDNQCASNFCQNLTTCAACTSVPNNCNIGTCVNGVCVIPPTPTPSNLPNGSACTNNSQCASGYCNGTCQNPPIPTPTSSVPTPTPLPKSISGRVYYDTNDNTAWDTGIDSPYDGAGDPDTDVTITGNPGPNIYAISLATGLYQSQNIYIPGNSYDITLNNIPSGCTTPMTTWNIPSMPDSDQGRDFPLQGCTPAVYSISGKIFNDANPEDGLSANESNYTDSAVINISPNIGTFQNLGGNYIFDNLPSGTYRIEYSGLPSGYTFFYPPENLGANSLIVDAGAGCEVPPPGAHDLAVCSLGSISNLNAAVTTSPSFWFQSIGTDIRWDNGFTNPVPSGKYSSLPGAGGIPGILFTGMFTPPSEVVSQNFNWKVGGSSSQNREVFTDTHALIPTSYIFLLETANGSNLTKKGVTDLCEPPSAESNCILKPSLANGIYVIEGNLTLENGSNYTFPANKNFVILIDKGTANEGDLRINHKIFVPTTSTVIFAASRDIIVNQSVGETASSITPSIEGIYSADRSFVADQTDLCPSGIHKRLNIAGSVIANAGRGGNGGTFKNLRSLCSDNANYPSVTFIERPDFIINFPNLIQQSTRIWQEVAP